MEREAKVIGTIVLSAFFLASCTYNPFINNNRSTGSAAGTAAGAAIGAGSVWALGGSKTMTIFGGIGGGAVGYYVTTLQYEAGGIIQAGGQIYKVGNLVGIYIPTDKLFEPNTADFLPQAEPILDSTVDVIQHYPENNIIISGNTSGFGRSRREQKLSERRAQKVADYLWHAGVNNFIEPGNDMRKLNYVGYGNYFPIANDITNESIRTNSRIQIISYPTACDLGLDRRHLAMHNFGGVDDEDYSKAPSCGKGDCSGVDP